jgi:hypothetical protein
MFKKNLDWEYQSGDYDGAESIATIIITLGAAAAYIFLSVGLLIWCRLRRRQRKLRSPNDGGAGGAGGAEAQLDVQTALREFLQKSIIHITFLIQYNFLNRK